MNLPALPDFVRDPSGAWRNQFDGYAALARECLAAAQSSYGISRRVQLRSARHYGKLARMARVAATEHAEA